MFIKCWIKEIGDLESNFILDMSKVRDISIYSEGVLRIHFSSLENDYLDFVFKTSEETMPLYHSFSIILDKHNRIECRDYFILQRLGD